MRDSVQTVLDNSHPVIEKTTSIVTYSASGVTVFGSLTLNEWMAVGGFVIGLASFAFNVWFKMKYKRPEKEDDKQC